jgi:hypothetical protein
MMGQRVHKVLLSLNVELNIWHVAEGRITCAEVTYHVRGSGRKEEAACCCPALAEWKP